MSADKRVKKYFENLPYGKDSLSSEIHGKQNQVVINKFVASLVRKYDEHMKGSDKEQAALFSSAVKRISTNLDNLKSIKEEFAMNYGGGQGGKNLFSNYTDLSFSREFFTENGDIAFDENLNVKCITKNADGEDVVKGVEDITENWVVKGTEGQQFMKMQQDAQKQRNTVGQPLDFDVDFAVDNLLAENDAWKVMVSDKVGGRYFLHDYLQQNQDKLKSGELTDDMLHPDSFNPEFDTRLHQYYSNRIKKSFDPNHQTAKERQAAEALIAKSNSKNNTENNQA
jgi:hypothetical protein